VQHGTPVSATSPYQVRSIHLESAAVGPHSNRPYIEVISAISFDVAVLEMGENGPLGTARPARAAAAAGTCRRAARVTADFRCSTWPSGTAITVRPSGASSARSIPAACQRRARDKPLLADRLCPALPRQGPALAWAAGAADPACGRTRQVRSPHQMPSATACRKLRS
jgi:hypothetical protein